MPAQGDCTSPSQCGITTASDNCRGCTTADYCTGPICQEVGVEKTACGQSGCNYSVKPKATLTILMPTYTGPWSNVVTRPGQNVLDLARKLAGSVIAPNTIRAPGDVATVIEALKKLGIEVESVEPDYSVNKAL